VSSRRRPENTWHWDGSQLLDLVGSDSSDANGTAPSPYQRLLNHLHYLELNTAAEHLKQLLDDGMRKKQSPSLVLERLLAHEVAAAQERRLRTRARTSHLPLGKTLENFDFDFQPSIDRQLVSELSTLRFIEEKRNVILVGPPGVGKSISRPPSVSGRCRPVTAFTSPVPVTSWTTSGKPTSKAASIVRSATTLWARRC